MSLGFVLKDNAGNEKTNVPSSPTTADLLACDLKVVYDNAAPKIATYATDVVFTNVSAGTGTGTQRNVSDSSICVITPTDPLGSSSQPASGIKSWMLKRNDTAVPLETDAGWNTAAAASIDISTEFKSLVTASAGSIYLFLMDNVGNRSLAIDLGNDDLFVKDDTPPVVTISTMAHTYPGGSGGTSYFVRGDATISFSAEDHLSSGVSKYLLSDSALVTSATVASTGTAFGSEDGTVNAVDVTMGSTLVTAKFDTADPRTIYLYVVDKAGNLTKYPIVTDTNAQGGIAVQAKLDATAPGVYSIELASGSGYDADGSIPVTINMIAADGSGVKVITFTGSGVSTDLSNLANWSAITVKANTDPTNLTVDHCAYNAGTFTITLASPCVDSGYLTVSNMRVGTTDTSVQNLTAKLTDAVGYTGSMASDSVTIDSSAPTIGSVTLAAAPVVTTGWTNSTSVVLTIPQTDVGSHVQKIVVTGAGFSSLSGATFTVGGSSVTPSVSGGTVTLSTPAASGSAIAITGLALTSGSGKKDITVTLTDEAGNTDGTSQASPSIDYDANAPSVPGVTIGTSGAYQNGTTYYLSGLTADVTLTGAEAATGHTASGWDHYYYTIGAGTVQTTIANGAHTVFAAGDSAGTTYIYHFHQIDKAGNPSGSTDVTFIKDATAPSISSSLVAPTTGGIGVNASNYYAQGAKITIAASDSSTGNSGVASYAISTAASAATVSNANSLNTGGNGRTNWNGASQDVDFTNIMNGSALTLYVWDNLGNANSTPIVYLANGSLPWNKDTNQPTLSLKLPPDGTVSPRDVDVTDYQTVYVNGTSIDFTATTSDTSGISSITASGSGSVTGNKVTLPAGSTYTITTTDKVGLTKAIHVTVTADTGRPTISFAAGSVTGSSTTKAVSVTLADSPSGVYSLASSSGSVSYTAGNGTGSVSGIGGDTVCKFTATDNVGNESSKWCFIQSDWTTVVNCVDVPEMWTISPSGSNYTVTATGAACKSWEITTSADASTGNSASNASISATLAAGDYKLKLTDWQSSPVVPQPHLVILFTIGSSGTVASTSVLGSTGIAARLSLETVTASVRKQSFDRARTSSKTNLPVWYTDVGKVEASAKTERSVTAPTNARTTAAQNFATPAGAGKTLSVEALHAAALSGMKATSANSDVYSLSPVKTVKANETMDFDDTVVMTAPEGSPAFVAYARGLAALRSVQDGSVTVTATRASFSISEGEKPVTVWEKLLAFFGIHDKEDHSEGEVVGFVSN